MAEFDKFMENIFNQPLDKAKRRNNGHFVEQEKKGLVIVNKIIKTFMPILKIKTKLKNKLIK